MSLFSYYSLVTIARGGELLSDDKTLWQSFFDLSIPIGDSILLILSVLIFIYSWKYLGGRFKKSILLILGGFFLLFLADFAFSFTDGNGTYYNGSTVDLLYICMVIFFGLGLTHLDPRNITPKPVKEPVMPYPQDPAVLTTANTPAPLATPTLPETQPTQAPQYQPPPQADQYYNHDNQKEQ